MFWRNLFGPLFRLVRRLRPLRWVASSKRDYGQFPPRVQDQFGFALFLAQGGLHPPSAKPRSPGYQQPAVLEVVCRRSAQRLLQLRRSPPFNQS